MPDTRDLTEDVDIDINGLFAALWRRKLLILLVTLIGGGLLFVILSSLPARYKGETSILIEKRESVFTRLREDELPASVTNFDEQAVGSQVQILGSDDLALAVIRKLELAKHAEFSAEGEEKSVLTRLLDRFRTQAAPRIAGETKILQTFRKRLQVYPAEKSRVIVIGFWAHDRELARDVPNAIAEEYLALTRETKFESNQAATEWLAPEIADLREKIREAEAKAAEFRATSDILIGGNNALLATQQLSEVSSELSRVRAERSSAEAKIDAIRAALADGGSVDVISDVLSSPLIQRLRERQATIEGDISQLSTTLLSNHPRIKSLRSQLVDINRQITAAAGNILKSLESNVEIARKQEAVLVQEVNRLKAESARVGEAEVELRALEREAAAQRELLQTYLTRFREAAGRQQGEYLPIDARVISRATLPASAYFPKVVPFTAAGTLALFLVTVVLLLAIELLSGRVFVRTGERIEPVAVDDTHRQPVATTPPAEPAAELAEIKAPPIVPAADALLSDAGTATPPPEAVANDREVFGLKTAAEAIAGLGSATIAVLSFEGVEGTPLAGALARSLAEAGQQTAIVDCTGDAATARAMLGETALPGLADVLRGAATLRTVLYKDGGSPAHVLAPGDFSRNEDGATPDIGRLPKVVEALTASYDFVVFDCGSAAMESLAKVAGTETVILVPVSTETFEAGRAFERRLRAAGYLETIMVRAERSEARSASAA